MTYDFSREKYSKLYRRESNGHKLTLSLFARGFRDLLIRYADPDGDTLIPSTSRERMAEDVSVVLSAKPSELRAIRAALESLLEDRYLTLADDGRLYITRHREAQQARSPGAVRQSRYRDSKRDGDSRVTSNVTGNATGDVSSDVTDNVTRDVTSDETRRDENRDPPVGPPVTPAASPPTEPPKPRASRSADGRGARISVDWSPDSERLELARTLGFDATAEAKTRVEFRDYWLAAAGQAARKVDWQRAYANRLRELADRRGQQRLGLTGTAPRRPVSPSMQAALDKMAAEKREQEARHAAGI